MILIKVSSGAGTSFLKAGGLPYLPETWWCAEMKDGVS